MIALSNCFSVLAVMVVVTCLPVFTSFPRNAPFKVYDMDLSFLIFLIIFFRYG
ncbi:putative membrane protein [Streptococcus pneumoniae NP127]|nr:putative membrane protein [Streptococcus pneumoniae NP127]